MSQEDLFFESEVHRTGISQFERGEHIPRCDTALKLCAGLVVTPSELFEGLSWTRPETTKALPLVGSWSVAAPRKPEP